MIAGVTESKGGAPDEGLRKMLAALDRGIHQAPNWTRHAMNNALIAIGGYRTELREEALAAAGRIGRVVVDHGKTNCKTPDAAAYIGRMVSKSVNRNG